MALSCRVLAFRPCTGCLATLTSFDNSSSFNLLKFAAWAAATTIVVSDASCEAPAPTNDSSPNPVKDVKLSFFKQWLQDHRADVSSVDFKVCQDASMGLGMYANEGVRQRYQGGFWRRAIGWLNPMRQTQLLAIPADLLINEHTVVNDERIGELLEKHMEAGNIDGRQAVMLWLVMHRAMGAASPWHPYISVLPSAFDTPLYYDDAELSHLAGTSLLNGTLAARSSLAHSWTYIQPVLRELQAAAGMHHLQLQQADYQWAFSLYWSRCYSLPLAADTSPDAARSAPVWREVETLVPGLDVANHSSSARCHWRVRSRLTPLPEGGPEAARDGGERDGSAEACSEAGSGGAPPPPRSLEVHEVQLVARNWGGPRAGQEVFIQYEETSNDSFMFAHGFAKENNPSDTVLVRVPLPPSDAWDDVVRARMLLLKTRGLGPHIVLKRPMGTGNRKADSTAQLTPEARAVIEVMIMTPSDLLEQLERADEPAVHALEASASPLGLDLAVYTTLCHLLEAKLYEMEGESGTGTLEDDIKLIEAGPRDMPSRQWHCLLYRSSQKRIVREYLVCARKRLLSVMKDMQVAADAELKDPKRLKPSKRRGVDQSSRA